MHWRVGKPYFYAVRFRWREAVRWAWYICLLVWLAGYMKGLSPEDRPPVQIIALVVLWLLARRDARRLRR